jgi:hypothetical protein
MKNGIAIIIAICFWLLSGCKTTESVTKYIAHEEDMYGYIKDTLEQYSGKMIRWDGESDDVEFLAKKDAEGLSLVTHNVKVIRDVEGVLNHMLGKPDELILNDDGGKTILYGVENHGVVVMCELEPNRAPSGVVSILILKPVFLD